MESKSSPFTRRMNWSREEWIIAYDACPKDKQSYGPTDPDVREVADFIGRTPAAVSRAFGNLWAAQTGGRAGLKHVAKTAVDVVNEFASQPEQLRSLALSIRAERLPQILTPRAEIVSEAERAPITAEDVKQAALASRIDSELYFVTERAGSIVVDVGVLLDILLIGTAALDGVTRLIQILGKRMRPESESPPGVGFFFNQNWRDFETGRGDRVVTRVIESSVPELSRAKISAEGRVQLAGFLSFIRGVRRTSVVEISDETSSPSAGATVGRPFTRKSLERLLKVDLRSASDESIRRLSDLVKIARRTGFVRALRDARRAAKRSHPPR